MPRLGIPLAFFTFVLGISNVPQPGFAARTGDGSTVGAALVQDLMREGEVPGLSLATVTGNRVSQVAAFGVTSVDTQRRVDKRTIFEAASLSKPVVAFAVMKLVDARKLRLDSPIADYADGGILQADPRWRQITVRMVLSHTSGLPNELQPGQQPSIDFEPGTRFSYSGLGFVFLQQAIEKVTGRGFEAEMERLVFQPLQMDDSSFVWRPVYDRQKASGHNSIGKPTALRKPDTPKAPSSLHTTAADYARFLRAVINREGLSSASWKAMTAPQIVVPANCVVCVGKPAGQANRSISWGLGWGIETSAGKRFLFHWGENNGDFQAFAIADPEAKRGLVILANSGNGLSIVPPIVERVLPGSHPAFAWMGYDLYNSPPRVVQSQIVKLGADRVLATIAASGTPELTESQWNRIGYQLLGRGRPDDAILVFAYVVRLFPQSGNAFDSLGEAYLAAGDKARALSNYRRSLELDPANSNARDVIAELTSEAPQ